MPVTPARERHMRRIAMSTSEAVACRVIQANIDKFNELLEGTMEPTKRAMIIRLLAEEEAKQVLMRLENEA
jgi:hypothetical protein